MTITLWIMFVLAAALEVAGLMVAGSSFMDFFVTETIELPDRRTEESACNSRELQAIISRLREATGDAGRVAETAVGQASIMTGEVEALGRASAAVDKVIRIISGIADQTNLLTLVATIKAARAGKLDRGFAVVASEVKYLARETAKATQKVSEQIAGIQALRQSVATGIHQTAKIFGQMDVGQARMNEVLEEQARMARVIDAAG